MLNLISNSLKFINDNGQIEVDIKVTRRRKLYIHLKNDGPSISKKRCTINI